MTETNTLPPAKTATPTTALVTRPYEPMAPIGSVGALKSLLEVQAKSIAQVLPTHITPERLIKTMLVAANRVPDILLCTQTSILETINRAAELGLDLSGTLGEAYVVPFNSKIKINGQEQWVKQATLIPGYRGLAKLARQSGEVKRIDADVVRVNDHFVFRKGSDARCEFIPNFKSDRGEMIGAYAFVQFKDGGEQFDFMPIEDIEKVRRRSKSGNDRDGNAIGAWKTDFGEMSKKTVFRRVSKWLPLSTEKFVKALEQDDDDADFTQVIEAATASGERGVAALAARLAQRNGDAEPASPAQQRNPQTPAPPIQESQPTLTTPQAGAAGPAEPSNQNQSAPKGHTPIAPTRQASQDSESGSPNSGARQSGPQPADSDLGGESQVQSDEMSPWEKMLATICEMPAATGQGAKVLATAMKALPAAKVKKPQKASQAECDAILETAREGRGFWAWLGIEAP